MKKRYAAGLALALVGILSGCGQPAADNTISLTPVEETTADQSGRLIEYNFSGHRSEAEGVLFGCYIWDGSTWQKDEDATFGLRCSATLGSGKGTIKFERDGDAANANYKIGMDSPQLGGYAQVMDSPERNSLPMEGLHGRNLSMAWQSTRKFRCSCVCSARTVRSFRYLLMRFRNRKTAKPYRKVCMRKRTL